jgi:hypothetical protein
MSMILCMANGLEAWTPRLLDDTSSPPPGWPPPLSPEGYRPERVVGHYRKLQPDGVEIIMEVVQGG